MFTDLNYCHRITQNCYAETKISVACGHLTTNLEDAGHPAEELLNFFDVVYLHFSGITVCAREPVLLVRGIRIKILKIQRFNTESLGCSSRDSEKVLTDSLAQ
jgi:hypothetical protein